MTVGGRAQGKMHQLTRMERRYEERAHSIREWGRAGELGRTEKGAVGRILIARNCTIGFYSAREPEGGYIWRRFEIKIFCNKFSINRHLCVQLAFRNGEGYNTPMGRS